jgi:hypothetical protein
LCYVTKEQNNTSAGADGVPQARDILIDKKVRVIKALEESMLTNARALMAEASAGYARVEARVKERPTTPEEIAALTSYVQGLPHILLGLQEIVQKSQVRLWSTCRVLPPAHRLHA